MKEPGSIRFTPACESVGATLRRTVRFRGEALRVDELEGTLERTYTAAGSFDAPGGAIVYSEKGTVLYRMNREPGWRVAAPASATFVEGPLDLTTRLAKGLHRARVVAWSLGTMPILERWLESRREDDRRFIGTHPIHPSYSEGYSRLVAALESDCPIAEHTIAGVVMEMAASLTMADNRHCLASLPVTLTEPLRRLADAVRADPSRPWPLKEASDFVGYSPFHFSRIFKAQVGMGFHEFVDRTRTELAVHMLTSTDHSIDLIASESGFGTSQGLRESVKEYLGLVPSELRSSPDDPA